LDKIKLLKAMGIGRFQVMALLQAARHYIIHKDLKKAKSFGLNRAIFYAWAKHYGPRSRPWISLKIEEILKEEFPEVFLSPEEYEKMEIEKKKKEKAKEKFYESRYKLKRTIDKIRAAIGDFFKTLGWDVMFFRAVGPYEFAMSHRLAKYYQPVVAGEFERVRKFIETKMGVPGVSQPW